ncbi:type III pantothenate kinase [Alkalihalobacillus sp. MEB130]|uniref:type III pantothenate kinase n=1 Tax=Alkalihalobacillus sp. MEB130 TaxID=2976704 RepID=UPI0028DE3F51|nr:type III pantothenate kinase [Alkalihalobacillus sp. MEB130]MDT8862666.1 type III pantothenate kinase [Alkalihalobacillus sp. MEB130]
MIMVVDVGNTNIVLGVYQGKDLLYHWRIATSRQKTEDEWAMSLKGLFEHEALSFKEIEGIIISSVVPPIMYTLELMCKKYFGLKPLVIGPGIKTGLNVKYDNPKEVGADRIVNAVAAIQLYGSPLIVVDFGTATTYCYINEDRQYMGGAISPGISISTEALYNRASKLPRIEIAKPQKILGTNTVHAMQAGIFYGYVGQVDGIVNRMKTQSKEVPTVIATGGMASLIASETETIDVVEPFLTLKGLQMIYEKNA